MRTNTRCAFVKILIIFFAAMLLTASTAAVLSRPVIAAADELPAAEAAGSGEPVPAETPPEKSGGLSTPVIIALITFGVAALILGMNIPAIIAAFGNRRENRLLPPDDSSSTLQKNNRWLVDLYENGSVIIIGPRGYGKDALTCHVIHLRNKPHYANMPYNDLTDTDWKLSDLKCGGNTFKTFAEGKITRFKPVFEPGRDIYITDGNVWFPSHMDTELVKLYDGLPEFLCLIRQLLQAEIHINLQVFDRLWMKFRVHYQHFIRMLGCVPCGDGLKATARYYSRLASAEANLLPPDGMTGRALAQFTATHGEIYEKVFYIPKEHLTYDTHYFGTQLIDGDAKEKAPEYVSAIETWRKNREKGA